MFLIRRKADGKFLGRAGRCRWKLPKRGWTLDPNDHAPYNPKLQNPKRDGGYRTLQTHIPDLYQKYLAHLSGWRAQEEVMDQLWEQFYELVEVEVRIK